MLAQSLGEYGGLGSITSSLAQAFDALLTSIGQVPAAGWIVIAAVAALGVILWSRR